MATEGDDNKLYGLYRPERKKLSYIKIEGNMVSSHEPGKVVNVNIEIQYRDFHALPDKMAQISGKQHFNFKLRISWDKENPKMYDEKFGVFSDDQSKIYFKSVTEQDGLDVYHRISKEMADQIDADEGDPMSAPPGPYKIQPSYQGRLIWLSGAPGTGKSTSAQLLGRLHGYVYYELDCFMRLKNPYIPLDVTNPTMMQDVQRGLSGEAKSERQKVIAAANERWNKMLRTGKDLEDDDYLDINKLSEAFCEDILAERRRIGGDWVVAGCITHRRMRDMIRSCLGPHIIFVILLMEEKEVKERIVSRHSGYPGIQAVLMDIAKLCLTVDDDEENVLKIKIDKSMTKEIVLELILTETENFYKNK